MFLRRFKSLLNCFILVLLLFPFSLLSQDYQWWANNVNWDGTTHWRNYITYSPKFLGPNALPIPTLNEGRTDSLLTLGSFSRFLRSTGDFTYAQSFFLTYPTENNKMSFDISWVPREVYTTSHDWKTVRKVHFPAYYDRHAMADIIFNSLLQLSKESTHWLDAAFRVSFRFATSTHVNAARGTDAPGYSFDVTTGKTISSRLRLFGMLGFYVWQTNRDDYLQNDAFLFGLGARYNLGNWSFSPQYRGYWGYIGDGDDNVASSLKINYKLKNWQIFTVLSKGQEDNLYNYAECGMVYMFKPKI